ncbi:MAG: membrane transport protein-domain-containing protein [Benniella sp.]|nr:MAG: membrane transport protein-domain-containing protein [Benniella sp.]
MEWLVLSAAAAEAVSQVLVIVACGVILSRIGYLSQSTQKSLSKLNLYFLTPCLLFTKIASTITWTQFTAYWPIPVFYALFSFISWIIAKVGSRLLGFSKNEEKFVIASVLFSNTNTLPLALLQSLAFSAAASRLMRDENDTMEEAAARGISYVLFYAIFGNLIRWSYGFTLLVPKDKKSNNTFTDESDVDEPLPTPAVLINVDMDSATHPTASTSTMAPKRVPANPSHLPVPGAPKSPTISVKSSTESILTKAASTTYERMRQVMTPPLVTALIALVVGLVPPLHHLFMSPDSNFYRFLVRPIESCGSTAIPMILLCLGAQVIYFVPSLNKSLSPSSKKKATGKTHARRISSPFLLPSASTGLGIYSDRDDLSSHPHSHSPSSSSSSSSSPVHGPHHTANSTQHIYGQGIDFTRSNVSSSATLLHFKDPSDATFHASPSRHPARIPGYGSTSSSSGSEGSDDDHEHGNEASPLLRNKDQDDISHYRVSWITPLPFILFSRMILVPLICLPAVIFHPNRFSPVLTSDPMFPLAMVLVMAAPTAINLIQQCSIKGFMEQEMAMVLFWSYCVFGIPCILAWSLIGLWAAGRE